MKTAWNILTKTIGTIVIFVSFVISLYVAIDVIKQSINEKLHNDDKDDGADKCPYKIGDIE